MLKLGRYIRSYSRLMIGLFALQFFAAGFCLIAPAAYASDMPMASSMQSQPLSSQSALNFDAVCDQTTMVESKHTDHEMMACAHCDLPDELISNGISNVNIDLSAVLLNASVEVFALSRIDLSLSFSTGPPLVVSPLFYHTNQRILV